MAHTMKLDERYLCQNGACCAEVQVMRASKIGVPDPPPPLNENPTPVPASEGPFPRCMCGQEMRRKGR